MNRTAYYLRITPDHLRVSLHSSGSEEELAELGSGQELQELLTRQGIVHGLDQDALTRAATSIDRREPLSGPLILALGTPPTAGRKGLQPRFTPVAHLVEERDENGIIQQVELALVPFVRKGEPLTEPGSPTQPQTGKNIFGQEIACPFPAEQVFLSGDNVTVDKESQQLFATVSGYPTFTSSKRGSVEHVHLGVEALIRTTPDRMQAQISVKPAPPGHTLPDLNTVLQILDEERIVFGRLNHAIDQCLQLCADDRQPHSAVDRKSVV